MAKPLIMVVDDEPEIADGIAAIIQKTGRYDTVTAYSAKVAFDILEKNKRFLGLAKNRVECIILDIKMPDMDGLQFLKKLRAKEGLSRLTPVIILSAYEDREKWAKATDPWVGQVAGYISKAEDKDKLIDTVNRVFHEEIGKMIDETRERRTARLNELKAQGKIKD